MKDELIGRHGPRLRALVRRHPRRGSVSIGRSALEVEDCVMELTGANLYYRVSLRGS